MSNMKGELSKKLPSFWVPALVPDNKEAAPMKKPDTTIYCPFSNKPISMKDLIEVKFKLLEDKDDKRSFITRENRYVCEVSNDVLGNHVPCVVLRTSGSVVTQEVVDKIIKKDMVDPTNGKKLKESDIIPIQRGGTGFAGSGVNLISKKVGPAMIS